MKLSEIQRKAFEENYEKFRVMYVKGENKTTSVEDIVNCKRRCVTIINPYLPVSIKREIEDIQEQLSGLYLHELPHFTFDCHRYLTEDQLPPDINDRSLNEQQGLVINNEELIIYDRLLFEEFGKNDPIYGEVKGIAFGNDGLVAQVWYDHQRMIDFTSHLGERVRREVPSMDFQWGMVKGKVPCRFVNLTRFTGREDGRSVVDFVDKNRDIDFGDFLMRSSDLVFSDHYIQINKTRIITKYNFAS